MRKFVHSTVPMALLLAAETMFAACFWSVGTGSSCEQSPHYGCGSDCDGWRCKGNSVEEWCVEGTVYADCWSNDTDTVCTHYTGSEWGWPVCLTCVGDTPGQTVTNSCSDAAVSGGC